MLRYAITDRHGSFQASAGEAEAVRRMVEQCARLARDRVDFVLVREKDLAAGALVALSRQVLAAVREAGAGARVLVAGRPDVALAAGADGVHLSSMPGELRPEQVRRVMPRALVTVSCHSVEEVRRVRAEDASMVLFAPVFGKWVAGAEAVPGAGLETLRSACVAAEGTPVLALGGVTDANARQCIEAGAAGVAGIRMFFG